VYFTGFGKKPVKISFSEKSKSQIFIREIKFPRFREISFTNQIHEIKPLNFRKISKNINPRN